MTDMYSNYQQFCKENLYQLSLHELSEEYDETRKIVDDLETQTNDLDQRFDDEEYDEEFDYDDELEWVPRDLEEANERMVILDEVHDEVFGIKRQFVLDASNNVISGPHHHAPQSRYPHKIVEVWSNDILMSEQILEEKRHANQ
jgi:hypothetical protein